MLPETSTSNGPSEQNNQFSCVFTARKTVPARKPVTFFRALSIHRKPSTKTIARKIAGKVRKSPEDITAQKSARTNFKLLV